MASRKILVAPLDWGLGHATRCIPVIHALLNEGHEVVIASGGRVEQLLRKEFPRLHFVYLKGYGLTYSFWLPAWLKILFQLPKVFFRMYAEHAALKKIIRSEKIDVVISDSRFGLWNKNICSVYMTHQVMIKCPRGLKIFEPLLVRLHRLLIGQYDHCWIPDYSGANNISGDLAHKYPLPPNARYVHPLSRYVHKPRKEKCDYDLCVVLSGPEPSRSDFEKICLEALQNYSGKSVLVQGNPEKKTDEQKGSVRIVSHLPAKALEELILSSKTVICRSGYSSIMDLVALQKNSLLVPTPGQTEQEYLAQYLSSQKVFKSVRQSEFSIEASRDLSGYSVQPLSSRHDDGLALHHAIRALRDSE